MKKGGIRAIQLSIGLPVAVIIPRLMGRWGCVVVLCDQYCVKEKEYLRNDN